MLGTALCLLDVCSLMDVSSRIRPDVGSGVGAPRPLASALVVLGLIVSACGVQGDSGAGASNDAASASNASEEVACSVAGGTRFFSSFLSGPEMSPGDFADTPIGEEMEAFFVDGSGAPEGGQYLRAEGFSIVSDSLVLGYSGQLPDSFFVIEDGEIARWGGCRLNRVSDDLVAQRWEPSGPVNPEAREISIQVEGGACVTSDGRDVLTDVVSIDVDETADHVEITAWTRNKPFEGDCAGIGIVLDSQAELTSPLGARSLLDGGLIPARDVSFSTTGDAPPTTAPENDDSSLGRLDCAPGVVVEERVPDTGQDPFDLAQAAVPAVVEVEPGQPLWWWGLDEEGAVIVGLALGDATGADYQIWTCDPPRGPESTPDQSPPLPDACFEVEELYPGANDLPEGAEVIAEFSFREGAVVVIRNDQPRVTYFGVIECFPGGGEGFSGGGPGETWQGCSRVDYSDAGYAIAIVEDPTWTIAVAGEPVDVTQAGSVGAAFVEGTFDRPPSVEILSGETGGC